MSSYSESDRDQQITRTILDAMVVADELEQQNRMADLLDHLRKTMGEVQVEPIFVPGDGDGEVRIHINSAFLALRAREAFVSVQLGQGTRSGHSFLALYEANNPTVPEADINLRYWMDRLRIMLAMDHSDYTAAAAWCLDFIQLANAFYGGRNSLLLFAEGTLAAACSRMGLTLTAESIYQTAQKRVEPGDANWAALAVNVGSFYFNNGKRAEAFETYDRGIKILESLSRRTLRSRINLIRLLNRRADCYAADGDWTSALADIYFGLCECDAVRMTAKYQGARSADAAISEDIENLLRLISRCDQSALDGRKVIMALLIERNSAIASKIRSVNPPPVEREKIYLSGAEGDATAAELTRYWHPIAESDLSNAINAETVTLFVSATLLSKSEVAGISALVVPGSAPKVYQWSVTQPLLVDLFYELMHPPPGISSEELSGWARPWHDRELMDLTREIVPVSDLERCDISNGLIILPSGPMWRFPYAAVPILNAPLGLATPFVLSTPNAINLRYPDGGEWIGHFDLISLPRALTDLRASKVAAISCGAAMVLFGSVAEMASITGEEKPSVFIYSGHGNIGRSSQNLVLANSENLDISRLRGVIREGGSAVLNACWLGRVHDRSGTEPVDLALSLIAWGAHSVVGGVGPVSDRAASDFMSKLMPEVRPGRTLAHSMRHTYQRLIECDGELPLSRWACYSTFGRSVEYLYDGEVPVLS